jgi:hypothetical protein
MTWWPRRWWTALRRSECPQVTEAHRRADATLREALDGRAESARLADSMEARARRNSFGEAMIELFRGHPMDGRGGAR